MKLRFIIISAILLAAVSCSKEKGMGDELYSAPIIQIGDDYSQDAVLVKFDKVLDDSSLRAIEAGHGVTLKKVFPSMPGKEELEKQFGLDRWYEAVIDDEEKVETKAALLSKLPSASVVEFECYPEKESDCKLHAAEFPSTKAFSGPFNDPLLERQWHYKNFGNLSVSKTAVAGADINVFDVWTNLCCGDPDIIVAVVDEGVKYTHPDLQANMWVNKGEIPGNGIDDDNNGYVDDVYGYNFINDGQISWDKVNADGSGDSGHGTHCAGTIAAVNNNNKGVCGVAGGSGNQDGCRIMSCQIFSGASGTGSNPVPRAIKYAADMGASIISCSFGYRVPFQSDNAFIASLGTMEIDAIRYFEASKNNPVLDGNIAIFASGNENHPYSHYPGAFYDIISVSAFGPDFLPTYYTNYGPGCNIAAPGGEAYHISGSWNSEVLSTVPTEVPSAGLNGEYQKKGFEYAYMQGTSMACPHVSGIVALALSYAKKIGKTFTRDEFKQLILSSTQDIDQRISSAADKTYAYGHEPLSMIPYYHQMGTGAIDAWSLMMHIEGLPTLTAQTGRQQWIDLTDAFGTSSISLTYLSIDVSESLVNSLGLQKISPDNTDQFPAVVDPNGYAYVQFGRLYIHPTKIGSGKLSINAIGGGDHLGGGDNPPGGMEITQTISLMAREANGGNGTGGWL